MLTRRVNRVVKRNKSSFKDKYNKNVEWMNKRIKEIGSNYEKLDATQFDLAMKEAADKETKSFYHR